MNPLFNALGGAPRTPFGNMANIMQKYQQFRQTFTGDPQQEVMKMMQSGKISQVQLNNIQQMVQQFAAMLPK